jgi:tetratricopeptide (TPR) repeat protein
VEHRLAESLASARRATELAPDNATAFFNLGGTLEAQGNLEEALAAYQRAAQLDSDTPDVLWKRAWVLLKAGDLPAGWQALEEWRDCLNRIGRPLRSFKQPIWRNEDLKGKSILLYCEWGFGDAIQFVRYLPAVLATSARVLLESPAELHPLFRMLNGPVRFIVKGEPLPHFDYHCPLEGLPYRFQTSLATIPAGVPYISADAEKVSGFRERLERPKRGIGRSDPPHLRVGLMWAGSKRAKDQRTESLALFAPLAEIPSICFVSLQKGPQAGQAKTPPSGMQLIDLTDELHDFSDTAALIENLDLVISVDTSVAHLAGAMGKSIWTLVPFNSDFRWLMGRTDSPWYPTMRLFRQKKLGSWDEPIAEMHEALFQLSRCLGR